MHGSCRMFLQDFYRNKPIEGLGTRGKLHIKLNPKVTVCDYYMMFQLRRLLDAYDNLNRNLIAFRYW
jgi:hypothetical protein